ncbi:LuxR C-terminal-related transcriptional regulator [Agromyces arachidis]|uniref:LuxR C-terminal-related transcriptional regulator n=1 Tax=Agromyces arachidis TaxID=766966 RepID=UPI004057CBE9
MTARVSHAIGWRDLIHGAPDDLLARVEAMPEGTRTDDPAALLALAASYRRPGATNPYAAEPYLDAADDHLAETPTATPLHVLARSIRSLTLRELGRLDEARQLLAEALEIAGAAEADFSERIELRAHVMRHDGICAMLQGRLAEARHALMRSLHVADARTPLHARVEACGCIALIDLRVGSLRSAEAHLELGRGPAASIAATFRLSTAPFRLAVIAADIERGRLDGLDAQLDALIADVAGTEYEPLARAALAALQDDASDRVVEVLQELHLDVREWSSPNLPLMLHDDRRVAFLVARREAVAARAALRQVMPDASHSQCPDTWLARLALDAGDPGRAIRLTDRCLAMGDTHSPRTAMLAILVSSAAHDALGDASTADALFAQALSLAAPTSAIRAFAVVPRLRLAALVERAATSDAADPVGRLVGLIAERYPPDEGEAPDTLTPRERLVLEHLVDAETQARISFALSVSPNTVKTQVRSIYRKLGVGTREGAVQRARTLGLID